MSEVKPIGEILDQDIPRRVVSERDGGGGRRLSYLEGHYVIDRLNKVFGHLSWSNEILEVREVKNTTSRGEFPAYLVKVRLTVITLGPDGKPFQIVKEGYGYGSDKSTQNAHELAMKEAVTDGLKVAAKNLGQSMGLALYDKTQANVSDEEETETPAISSNSRDKSALENHNSSASNTEADSKKIQEAIKSEVRVAVKLAKTTVAKFKEDLKTKYSVDKLESLNASQLSEVYKSVRELTGGSNVH